MHYIYFSQEVMYLFLIFGCHALKCEKVNEI